MLLRPSHASEFETFFNQRKQQLLKAANQGDQSEAATDFLVKGFFQQLVDKIYAMVPELHRQHLTKTKTETFSPVKQTSFKRGGFIDPD